MHRNFIIALVIVVCGGLAAPAAALTADDLQGQIQRLMAQVRELTARLNEMRANPASSASVPAHVPGATAKHRICAMIARNLSQGSTGDDVLGLQEFLQEKGLLSAQPTGYFGSMTAEAVRRWQAQEGVSAVGSFGPLSRERLKAWCGGGSEIPGQRFSATPQRGESPLTVSFHTWLSGFRVPNVSYTIDFGDGTSERAADCPAPADACTGPGVNTHTYSSNGTYTATLSKITDPCPDDGDPTTPRCLAAIQSEVVGKVQIQVGSLACTKEYKPVCGGKPIVCITTPCDPIPTTYGNRCEMHADGASFLYEGQCRTTNANPADDPTCKAWFDGCNSCARSAPGEAAACTLKYCVAPGKAYCTARFTSQPVACTADAMQCPNGDWVGRTGPNCQFVCN